MTIENSTNKMLPQQMGITVNYPFTFNVILQDPTEEEAKKAIKATVLQKDGTEIELIYNTDYTIVLNTNRIGGTLTVKNMRTAEDKIVIYRQYKQTQEADYKDFNASPAETLEQCLDKLTMLSQQQQEEINRSIKIPVTSEFTNLAFPLPASGKTLKWNKEETGLVNSDLSIDEIESLIDTAVVSANTATVKANEASDSAILAEEWASKIGDKVDTEEYSAKHYAMLANDTVNGAMADIENARVGAIDSIDDKKTSSIEEVNTTKDTSINAVIAESNTQKTQLQTYVSNAKNSEQLAKDWATKLNARVDGIDYSAKYYAQLAKNNSDINYEQLRTSTAYLNDGNVLYDVEGFNDIKNYYHSTFDLSKYSKVGSFTISDDGIASDFSNSIYNNQSISTVNTIDTANAQTMKIHYVFKLTKDLVNSGQIFLLNYSSTAINGKPNIQLYQNTLTASAFGSTINLKTGSTYKIEFDLVVEGTSYYRVFEDGILLIEKGIENYTEWRQNNPIFLYGYYTGENYNSIEIDLKKFCVAVDGQEVFNGNKTGLDIIKEDDYTIVGTPTISEDGILSGNLDINNCIKSPIIDTTNANTMDIEFSFTITRAPNDSGQTFLFNFSDTAETVSGPELRIYHNILRTSIGSSNIILNIDDSIKYEGHFSGEDGQICIEKIYKNGELILTRETTSLSSTWKKSSTFWFGSGHGAITEVNIPLSEIKIYVDGILVYQPCLKIPYNKSKTGSKIVPSFARVRVQDVYEQYGQANYYTIDEENKNFTLPMGEIYGMIDSDYKVLKDGIGSSPSYIIETYKNGASWYRIWSDGLIEQGGHVPNGNNAEFVLTLLVEFSDTDYKIFKNNNWYLLGDVTWQWVNFWNKTTTSATTFNANQTNGGDGFDWYAFGY